MSEIIFHVNAADPLAHACRLVRKALDRYSKIVVSGEEAILHRFDTSLWTFAAQSFVPHCWSNATETMVRASPVVLANDDHNLPSASLLVKLGGSGAMEVGRFPKVIEVVGGGESTLRSARQRWKDYLTQGHSVRHHDLARSESSNG